MSSSRRSWETSSSDAVVALEGLLELLDRRQVEVVGGLVEDQQVHPAGLEQGEGGAGAFAGGELPDRAGDLVGLEAELRQERADLRRRQVRQHGLDGVAQGQGASLGASVAVGEIDQARTGLAEDLPLGDAFEAAMPRMTPAEVRTLLAKFGLRADQVTSRVGKLSPGERTRAAMALLQARGVNLLVLDEPTNHLDLPAIEQLEQALEGYDGSLLLVSHDRRLLDTVRLDQRWHVEEGRVTVSHVG